MAPVARYEGLADWYDKIAAPSAASSLDILTGFLNEGSGIAIDLGCGTGLYLDALAATGRMVLGVDLAGDLLRTAASRGHLLVQADAAALPIRGASIEAVAAIWVSTDVNDFGTVVREAVRVLQPGGALLVYGAHPCFNGPFVENLDDGSRVVHAGYRAPGWVENAPWWGDGVRRRVGMRHVPLPELINSIIDAGLVLTRVDEPREEPVPFILALRSRKP